MKASTEIGRWIAGLLIAGVSACGGGGGGGAGAPPSAGTIEFRETTFEVEEGTVVNIRVARTDGSSGVARVDYATADGTAVAPSDYAEMSGTFTWTDGVSGNQTISIPITDDDVAELTESFTVTLSNAVSATLGADSTAIVSIDDNDAVAQLPITPGNAQVITAVVLEQISGVFDLIGAADLLDLPLPLLPAYERELGLSGPPLVTKPRSLRVAPSRIVGSADIAVPTVACDSGTATAIRDTADSDLHTSNHDNLFVSFAGCFFSDSGVTLSGAASMTEVEINGDVASGIPPWRVSAAFTFIGLEVVERGESLFIDGGFDLALSANDAIAIDRSISGTSLVIVSNGRTSALGDFNLSQAIDLNNLTVAADARGMLTSTELDGTVEFETLASFVSMHYDQPSAGALFVSDGDSTVLVTVLDNMSVQLEVDEDADGTAESTLVVAR